MKQGVRWKCEIKIEVNVTEQDTGLTIVSLTIFDIYYLLDYQYDVLLRNAQHGTA